MTKIKILTVGEYLSLRPKTPFLDPLALPELFDIEPALRRGILKHLFPKSSEQNDQIYYRWMWEMKPNWCEECGKPLKTYWSGYISHILSRGAHTDLRYDPLNSNILCNECHQLWETGKQWQKETMYIYVINQWRINYLTF